MKNNTNNINIRVLFIALAHSSHTISWVKLFHEKNIEFFLFGLNGTTNDSFPVNRLDRFIETPFERLVRKLKRKFRIIKDDALYLERRELSYLKNYIIKKQPNVIHTLGFEPAGYKFIKIYFETINKCKFSWVHTARGGPELVLNRFRNAEKIKLIFANCNYFIADNSQNYQYAIDFGLKEDKIFKTIVPGTGGVDLSLIKNREIDTLNSRTIIIPKAYECLVSKSLPIFEALRNIWELIQPCKVILTASTEETKIWLDQLPDYMKTSIFIYDRIPRDDLFKLYCKARVLLAPSLLDGIPNVLYEAMAFGIIPIVSPIETLVSIFKNEENVIYARNLYVNELEGAILKAMNDSELGDLIIKNNLSLVKKIANREYFQEKLIKFYHSII